MLGNIILLHDLGFAALEPHLLMVDNTATVQNTTTDMVHRDSRHMAIRLAFLREQVRASLVQVPPGLAIGDSTLLTAKGILVGVEQGAHLNAPRTRARQGLDGGPVSQIEHLHVDLVPSLAAVDQL